MEYTNSELHDIVKQELANKTYDKDLWRKAMALMGSDEYKAKEKYTKLRIIQLKKDGYHPNKKDINSGTGSTKKRTAKSKEDTKTGNTSSNKNNINGHKKDNYNWIFWFLMAFLIIFAIIQSNINSHSSKKTSNTSSSKKENSTSNYTVKKKDNYLESKPLVSTYTLSKNQLLYCEAEVIRLDIVKDKIDKNFQEQIDKYNTLTRDYNARCADKKYNKNDMNDVNRLIENRKYKIEQEGLDRFKKKEKKTNLNKMLFQAKPSSSSRSCKVTIFKDGSIGAELNGVFKQWKTMLLSERNKCNNALKNEQKRSGREGNTYETKTKQIYPLTINTVPWDARVQIMNIKPKYYDGIRLKKGKYRIRVSKKGYETRNLVFDPSEYEVYNVILKKRSNTKSTKSTSANCKVTIFDDGSIGARMYGTYKTWKSMSAWERKQCGKALKKEQKRVGRKGNTYVVQGSNRYSQMSKCKVTIFKDGSIGAELNGVFKEWKNLSAWDIKQCEKALKKEQDRVNNR